MEDAMGTATTTSTPVSQVDDLIKQVAEESGLEISAQLASVPSAAIGEASASAASENPLEKRLAALRSWKFEPSRNFKFFEKRSLVLTIFFLAVDHSLSFVGENLVVGLFVIREI